jgi:hypothetical protein
MFRKRSTVHSSLDTVMDEINRDGAD